MAVLGVTIFVSDYQGSTMEAYNYNSDAYPFNISLKAFNTPSGYLMYNVNNNESFYSYYRQN